MYFILLYYSNSSINGKKYNIGKNDQVLKMSLSHFLPILKVEFFWLKLKTREIEKKLFNILIIHITTV